jgi:hypothetical protein
MDINMTVNESPGLLELARSAARAYAAEVRLPAEQAGQLAGAPILGPVDIGEPDAPIVVYRWLGGGRGGPFLQAEVQVALGRVTVFSGSDHEEQDRRTYLAAEFRGQPGS